MGRSTKRDTETGRRRTARRSAGADAGTEARTRRDAGERIQRSSVSADGDYQADMEARRRRAEARKRRRLAEARRRRIRILAGLAVFAILLVALLVIGIAAVVQDHREKVANAQAMEEEAAKEQSAEADAIKQAELMAQQYDYDGAIQLLESQPDAASSEEIQAAIAGYQQTQSTLVEVDPEQVTHIFYHSLVVDTSRAFTGAQGGQYNMWMTTVDEFNKITQTMYDRGFVLVRLRDLVNQTTDADGNVHFEPAKIMLPPDKKAFVLSLDDLSYYHGYDGYGMATKLILDENGKVTNEYIDESGNTVTGAYDCVPLLDAFIEEHPDFSYHGAKGIIALTGYNGILGYRTDQSYQDRPDDLDSDKVEWLDKHPDFNLETERAGAKEVADAMRASGWEFASHTWGHLNIGDISFDSLQTDTEKWLENVAPLVGGTDTIIFAHGQDLNANGEYTPDNEKYSYLKSQGFNFFCNVDSTQYCTQITEDYVHQGRRNVDGYRMYHNPDMLTDLFDVAEVFDPGRPTPVPEE